MPSNVCISAPCRLHFGLRHVPVPDSETDRDAAGITAYGGLGLMINTPRVEVTLRAASEFNATGSLAVRALSTLNYLNCLKTASIHADGPPEHTGFGIGTALTLAVTQAVADFIGDGNLTAEELVHRSGRGQRSRIGVAGFLDGGFIIDPGHQRQPCPPARMAFPDDWRIVLVQPREARRWHGEREQQAFASARTIASAIRTTRSLLSIEPTLIDALASQNFGSFAQSLHDYNRIAGEPFAVSQQGPYSDPATAACIETLRGWGYSGVGQSSWGPTVFVVTRSVDDAESLASRIRRAATEIELIAITTAANTGFIRSEP
jgi:beta-ribofuranosylaminobenzene 5'-phosphate synthase